MAYKSLVKCSCQNIEVNAWIFCPGWQVMFHLFLLVNSRAPFITGSSSPDAASTPQFASTGVPLSPKNSHTRATAFSEDFLEAWCSRSQVVGTCDLVSTYLHTPEIIRSNMSKAKHVTETNPHSNQFPGAERTSGRRIPALWVLNVSRRGRNTCSRRWRCLAGQMAFSPTALGLHHDGLNHGGKSVSPAGVRKLRLS